MASDVLIAKLFSLYLFDKYNINLSYSEMLSFVEILSDDDYRKIEEVSNWIDEVQKRLTIVDIAQNTNAIQQRIITFLNKYGSFEEAFDSDDEIYKPKEKDSYFIIGIDHVGLIPANNGTIKDEIDKTCNLLVKYKNIANITSILVQQTNRNFKDMSRRQSDHNYIELHDVQSTSATVQAAEIVIAVNNPHREKMRSSIGFDIATGMKDRFRMIALLKNRYGESDKQVGSFFYGKVGYFQELNSPRDGMTYDYNKAFTLNGRAPIENQNKKQDFKNVEEKEPDTFEYSFSNI